MPMGGGDGGGEVAVQSRSRNRPRNQLGRDYAGVYADAFVEHVVVVDLDARVEYYVRAVPGALADNGSRLPASVFYAQRLPASALISPLRQALPRGFG